MRIKDKRGYTDFYLAARSEIDNLCDLIRNGAISKVDALDSYLSIADNFLKEKPQKAELFNMVYKSRIIRLGEQFLTGAGA
ncbi:MAG: hypothetical protein V3W18_03915 [candidate division Zixibacteria bacterium]